MMGWEWKMPQSEKGIASMVKWKQPENEIKSIELHNLIDLEQYFE